MDDLVICVCDLWLDHQLFENVAILNLADAQDGVVNLVLLLHGADDLSHVVEFLAVLDLGPLVCSVGKILVIVLAFVMVGVKQVFKVVETDHMALLDLLGSGKRNQDEKGKKYAEKSLHNLWFMLSSTTMRQWMDLRLLSFCKFRFRLSAPG